MVEQLGLAMIPLCFEISEALISGMTSGTEASIRKALVLSTTTAPAFTASGTKRRLTVAPALERTRSIPLNDSGVAGSIVIHLPWNFPFLPADLSEAST